MKKLIKTLAVVGTIALNGCTYMGLPRAPIEQVRDLKNGYSATKSTEMQLDFLSRIYSGNSEVTTWDHGYHIKTSAKGPRDLKIFKKICLEADTDEDHLITLKESNDLTDKIGRGYTLLK